MWLWMKRAQTEQVQGGVRHSTCSAALSQTHAGQGKDRHNKQPLMPLLSNTQAAVHYRRHLPHSRAPRHAATAFLASLPFPPFSSPSLPTDSPPVTHH